MGVGSSEGTGRSKVVPTRSRLPFFGQSDLLNLLTGQILVSQKHGKIHEALLLSEGVRTIKRGMRDEPMTVGEKITAAAERMTPWCFRFEYEFSLRK
ncbi:hypothetical protein L484_017026 [Morus notabilis]|uniref:Uncharacterized protein n=1 Tax=Morus notabilis TaxID=981085 RepID=W9RU71_9ROSA|nr:hypothetical protein L484_017026 [Morus notabilis]